MRSFAASVLFTLGCACAVRADCGTIGKETQDAFARYEAGADEYISAAARIANVPDKVEKISIGLGANAKLLEDLDRSIQSLERGKVENCFGNKSSEWTEILGGLKLNREELIRERKTLTKFSQLLQQLRIVEVKRYRHEEEKAGGFQPRSFAITKPTPRSADH